MLLAWMMQIIMILIISLTRGAMIGIYLIFTPPRIVNILHLSIIAQIA